VTEFLVNDKVPDQRETVCPGHVADPYVTVAPRSAKAFADPAAALSSMESEIYYLPEFFYWDGFTSTVVGCTYGGTLKFDANNSGTAYFFGLNHCELTGNFKMTGTGSYNIDRDRFVLDIKTTGRWTCDLKYARTGERININGKCDGKPIARDQDDKDREKHQMPSLQELKKDNS